MATTPHPLLFQGTLLNRQSNPINGAKIQLWQTDLNGNYDHPNPNAAKSPIVSNFQYYGTDTTDVNGKFHFITYRPGIYTQRPYSHFHFMVWLEEPIFGVDEGTGENPVPDLVTQFYFADESGPFPNVLQLNVMDVDNPSIYGYGKYMNGTIVVDDGSSNLMGVDTATLLDTSPTQPQGPFYPVVDFFSMDNDLTTVLVEDDAKQTTNAPTESPETSAIPNPLPNVEVAPSSSAPIASVPSTISPVSKPTTSSPLYSRGTDTLMPTSAKPTIRPSSSSATRDYNALGSWGALLCIIASYHLIIRN